MSILVTIILFLQPGKPANYNCGFSSHNATGYHRVVACDNSVQILEDGKVAPSHPNTKAYHYQVFVQNGHGERVRAWWTVKQAQTIYRSYANWK